MKESKDSAQISFQGVGDGKVVAIASIKSGLGARE